MKDNRNMQFSQIKKSKNRAIENTNNFPQVTSNIPEYNLIRYLSKTIRGRKGEKKPSSNRKTKNRTKANRPKTC